MSAPSSKSTESLGQVVRDLRHSVGETQGVFADRFGYGRTHITEIENNRLSGKRLRGPLVEQFSGAEQRINTAVDMVEPRVKRDQTFVALRHNIESLIKLGQLETAVEVLQPHMDAPPNAHYWVCDQLWWLLTALDRHQEARQALTFALSAARLPAEKISCVVRMSRHSLAQGDFVWAHKPLDLTLEEHPDSPSLWLQKGEVFWIEEAYGPAYASLTTALRFRAKRNEVLRLRAQVLADWGSFDAALADIDDYLASDPSTPLHTCEVLGARAYVLGMTRKPQAADQAFTVAEQKGGSSVGLLHYRRADYYHYRRDDDEAALAAYKRAIACDKPVLDHRRREIASERISRLERELRDRPAQQRLTSELRDRIILSVRNEEE